MTKKSLPPLLWIATGSIGDALMTLALCSEVAARNPGVTSTIFVRKNFRLVSDLAAAVPSVTVRELRPRPLQLLLFAQAFLRRWSVMAPWKFGNSPLWNSDVILFLFSLRPGTRIASFFSLRVLRRSALILCELDRSVLFVDRFRILARAAGHDTAPVGSPVLLKLRAVAPADAPAGAYIVFHPFGSGSWKSWPPRRSRELLAQLHSLYPGFTIVLTGGPEDREEAEALSRSVPGVQLAIGKPILEAAGLIQNAKLYIGVDTGTTHLAGVLNAPSVVLAHLAEPAWLPTYNPNAIILSNPKQCGCDAHPGTHGEVMEDGKSYIRCLYDITDEQIQQAVEKFLPHAKTA